MDVSRLKEKPFYLNEAETQWVMNTFSEMSDREKCSQLFCLLGDAYSEENLKELIQDWGIGGVLFRPGHSQDVQKKYANARRMAKIPLLCAANLEEGGAGIISDGTYFANNLQIGAADDVSYTRMFAASCAKEGKSVGVNWSFSPVVDIDLNYHNPITNMRTFGSDPDLVLRHAKVFTETLQRYGIAASCKHFPGDGVDYRDQHLHPTYNSLSASEWFSSYGRIYHTLIQEGLLSIMVGHIIQPNVIREINPDATQEELLPASLSKELLTGVLRERFDFQGVIITDATIMGGYTMSMERKKAIPHSIESGCDMLCFSTDIREDIGYLINALDDGRLSETRLNDAIIRILALKAVLNRENPFQNELADLDIQLEQRKCAKAAITLVKDTQQLIPLSCATYSRIRLVILGQDQIYDGTMSEIALRYLTEKGFEVEIYDPMGDDLHGTAAIPSDRITLILCNMPAMSNQTTVRISWCPKHALEIPRFVNEEKSVFISFANPYHLQDVPRIRTYINAYSATRATIISALKKMTGDGTFIGHNPVDPFCGLPDTRI